jgi:hypothetical protein
MSSNRQVRVESDAMSDFAGVLQARDSSFTSPFGRGNGQTAHINLDPDKVKNGLGQLVLTLVKLLHELLERQAIRRIDSGSLSDGQIERLGVTLMKQAREIERLRREFGLEEEDLNLDLGPLGKLL